MEYNFDYITKLFKTDVNELTDEAKEDIQDISNNIHYTLSNRYNSYLFHLIPVLYSMTFLIGSYVFTYKVFVNND